MEIKGIDVSHWNSKKTIEYYLNKGEYKFLIAKATEGKGYKDPELIRNLDIATSRGLIFGVYHYARPEKNYAKEEAELFVQTCGWMQNCIYALDWEGEALKYDVGWIVQWCEIVEARTGVKPILYIPLSYWSKCKILVDKGYKLWYPKYGPVATDFKHWDKPLMWQYTSKPIDTNIFYGTLEELNILARGQTVRPSKPEEEEFTCKHIEQLEEMLEVWKRERDHGKEA